ncbi:unnamed protein product [Rotaria sp. Silwood2]|nr:unnamed protein product [Rotaria sp. Silwood2]
MSLMTKKVDEEDFAERFHRIAYSRPSSTCLIIDENLNDVSEYTYASVHDASCRFERGLRTIPIEPKQLIAIQMERSANLVISVVACLLHRSPFVLIEPNIQGTRRNLFLTDTMPALLITDQTSSITDSDLPTSAISCSFSEILQQGYQSDILAPLEIHSCDDTMCIIYTSGSTGQPKGVLVPYRAIYNRFRWMWRTYPWSVDDVQLWQTSVMFSDYIWEMLGGLLTGVPTVVASATTMHDSCLLLQLIQRTAVTRITLIPSVLSRLLKLLPTMLDGCLNSLRYVIVSGETLPKIICKEFLALSSKALLVNLYGSTETVNGATYYEVRHLSDEYDTVPIGKPIDNIYYKIVSDELWIFGDGLCNGYLNDSDMTASKFRYDVDGRRYFKTGDCARECDQTGQLLFLGRIDSIQVKSGDARIRLEEVEAVCMQNPLVRECGCFIHEAKAQLIAVVHMSSCDLSDSVLQQWIRNHLPEFEVPSVFICATTALPRTTSGKIDRKQLVLQYENRVQDNSSLMTNGINNYEHSQRVMDLWYSTLETREDDEKSSQLTFTELGGHSLPAMQLQCALRREFNIQVPIEQFFSQTNLSDLIEYVENSTPMKKSFEDTRGLLELKLDIISPSTAVFNVLAQQEASQVLFNSLRKIYFGGEKVNIKHLRRAMEHQVLDKFVHVYGPTETTVFALFYELSGPIPGEALTVPIGTPLTNTSVYIVDKSFQLMPRGVPGELLIGGMGLSYGYHNRTDLTQQKFIPNPFGEGLVYCTGDICRMLDNGNIEFLYREDNQVKLRSQRLELGEIEFHLLQHELIADAIVILREDITEEEKYLVGYVQPLYSSSLLDSDEVRTFLTKRLPEYMIPTYIVPVAQFPLNTVGKIDKKSLPKPSQGGSSLNIPGFISQICAQVLKNKDVDMNSNFFRLGGHSLSAMEMIAKLYETLGVQITIPMVFQAKSMFELARCIESQISQNKEKPKQSIKIFDNIDNQCRAPLTPAQQQFWLLWKLKPDSCYYNVPIAFEITGELNVAVLSRSLHYLMSKFALLRTKFEEESSGTCWQEEKNDWNLPFMEESIEGTLQMLEVRKRLQYYSMREFDLKKGDTCRFVILHLSGNQHVLLICFHHIVCDGQSVTRFFKELFDLYAAGNSTVLLESNKEKSFYDYAINVSETPCSSQQLNNMVNYLSDFRSLMLDTDFGVQQDQDIVLDSHIFLFLVPTELATKLRELAISHACTLHTLLLTLFKCLLSVYCFNTSDIVLGSIISLRSQPGISDLFGPLINTIPIRTRLPNDANTTFIDLLESVRDSVLFGMEHQMVPFADIVQRLRLVSTDPSLFTYLPVVRVLFQTNTYNLFNRTETFSDGTKWASVHDSALLLPYTKSDIDLEIMDYGSGQPFSVGFHLNCKLFRSETTKIMANCYRCALETIAKEPTCLRTYLWQRLQAIRQNDSDMILHECFRRRVETRPDHQAVIYQDQVWTYAELLQRAEQIASYLYDREGKSKEVIGLYMKRCPHLIAAMLGVLMAGSTYLYLDPELPDKRIRIMLQDAGAHLVIEDEKETSFTHTAFESIRFLSIDFFFQEYKRSALFPVVKPSDSCYVIYTSGSTGEPKGILIQHQAVVRRVRMPVAITPSSRVAQLCSCSFDVYILEIYGALLNGATLIIYDKALIFQPKVLYQQIIQQHITHMYLPTPIFNILAEYVPDVFANMECVLFAGDRANAKLMRTILQKSEPPKRLINAYGPTETTCIATWYDTSINNNTLLDDTQVPIGLPLPDTPLYIVNPTTLELVEDGEEGELLIGGYGVSNGYINNIDLTTTKFVLNRYGEKGKVYRSGDRVRRCPDGNLLFLSRLDTQMKVNGFRIELAEIEQVLQGYSTITEAVVLVRNDIVPNTQSIVAYVRPKKLIESDIRQYLTARLPSYMLPSFIVPIDQFPISFSGGKRDVNILPLPSQNSLSEIESKIQLAWNNVLNLDVNKRVFKADDDFFMCGGTSINIVKLHTQLEQQFGLTIDPMILFEQRTITAQVRWLASLVQDFQKAKTFQEVDTLRKGVAIIGLSARYGPTETADDLWTALRNGVDCCSRLTHKELLEQDPSMASLLATNPNYVQAGSTMNNAYCFDHAFFGMTKIDAEITDPQHRIMLESTYEALENAGLVPQSYTGTIGMFGTISRNTYAECYNLFRANPYEMYDATKASMGISTFDPATIMRVAIGNMTDGAPTFISYKLGLNGPAMAIQTACSSSGTALHVALRSLEVGDCTVAIVAGVCINFPLGMGYNYQPGMIMSKTGVCHAFDEGADGVVGGDGAGVVVLMKITEAEANGYPIRAIITGYAINNDGQKKATYSTTSPEMQASCMQRALSMAQIQYPQLEIDYVEGHGAGTQMGDLLEIQALTKTYKNQNQPTQRQIYLGSIKTNVGHTAHAATIAGLIKIILSLEACEIPSTLNFHHFSSTALRLQPPFEINTETITWPRVDGASRPRRAALNALGQGGTNTHFIIEQGYSPEDSKLSSKYHIFLLSAKTDDALSKVRQRLLDHLIKVNDNQLANIAFTLACGRIAYSKRCFVVACSTEDLKRQLSSTTIQINKDGEIKPRLVLVFSGQGNQYAGMAQLQQCGALLFRGFAIDTPEDFSQVVEALADNNKTFLDYRDGISPRTRLTDKVFTSTEYPNQLDMALHNEMSYSNNMPSMIFFFCQIPPDEGAGGETPIANSAAIFDTIDPDIRQEFIDKELIYVTNLPSKISGFSVGKTWQDTYQTESKEDVEAFLKDKHIQFRWLPNDRLRTVRRGQAVRLHQDSGTTVWCNHAHLFHPTDLNQLTRQALQKRLEPLDMPKNCFFGNGDTIPDTSLHHIRQVLKQHEVKWPWRKGDVLVLDNIRTAHGRASFTGQRRILVAMC